MVRHLKFFEPIGIYDRLNMVEEWMSKLDETIKRTLREIYKKASPMIAKIEANNQK